MSFFISPIYSLTFGYIYGIILLAIILGNSFFNNHSFFSWGTPVILFGTKIESKPTFYVILSLYFIHQLISNWINNTTYPWIINSVQNSKVSTSRFTKITTITLINLFNIYNQFNLLFIISSVTTQISFFLAILLANIISSTIINSYHYDHKYKSKVIVKKDNYGTFTIL